MTLHLINKSPGNSSALDDALALLLANPTKTAILLIEDAVYSATDCPANSNLHEKLKKLARPCYVLKEDLKVRGLSSELADCFSLVDYEGFVQLSLEYDKVQSWT